MNWILAKLRALFRKEKLDREMAEEIRFHLSQRTAENVEDGLAPDEAHFAARRKFGGVEQIKERARDERGWVWLEHFRQDLAYGGRQLARRPGFAFVIVATLAIGIGANTSVFTLMNALLLRKLPVRDPDALVLPRKLPGDASFTYPTFARFREHSQTLEGVAAAQSFFTQRWLTVAVQTEPVRAQAVSGNFFAVLGAMPAIGRTWSARDDSLSEPAVMLGDGYWRRRFGSDPTIVGQAIELDGVALNVVGVMPPRFTGIQTGVEPDLWFPVELISRLTVRPETPTTLTDDGWDWLLVFGRLKPGMGRAQSEAEFRTLYRQELESYAANHLSNSKRTEKQQHDYYSQTIVMDRAATGQTPVRDRLAVPLVILTVVAGLVLLIACANVGGLLLARGAARAREFAVRTALGAGRGRIVRQLLAESLIFAILGGVGGLFLAQWGTAVFASYIPAQTAAFDLGPDRAVLLFTTGVSLVTGVVFGLLPAWRGGRVELAAAMKAGSGQASGARRGWLSHGLVVLQVTLSVTLLAGAGLFVRTLQKLQAIDLGFRPESVMSFGLDGAREPTAAERTALNRRVLDTLRVASGVRNATLASGGLLSGQSLGEGLVIDRYVPDPDEIVRSYFTVVGPQFFETLGATIVRGRALGDDDHRPAAGPSDATPRHVVVNEAFARHFFGANDPIGRTLRRRAHNAPPLEVVGVVRDAKYRALREAARPVLYLPTTAAPADARVTFYVRAAGSAESVEADVRAVVKSIDAGLKVTGLRPLDEVVADALVQERVVAQLAGFFSLFAMLLASLGLYGMLSHGVARRTRELGVRVALGATRREIFAIVMREGLGLAVLGGALGLCGDLAVTRLVSALLYDVSPNDPLTFAVTAAVLLAVALLACWVPARRATKVDPMVAMRCE